MIDIQNKSIQGAYRHRASNKVVKIYTGTIEAGERIYYFLVPRGRCYLSRSVLERDFLERGSLTPTPPHRRPEVNALYPTTMVNQQITVYRTIHRPAINQTLPQQQVFGARMLGSYQHKETVVVLKMYSAEAKQANPSTTSSCPAAVVEPIPVEQDHDSDARRFLEAGLTAAVGKDREPPATPKKRRRAIDTEAQAPLPTTKPIAPHSPAIVNPDKGKGNTDFSHSHKENPTPPNSPQNPQNVPAVRQRVRCRLLSPPSRWTH